MSDIIQNPNGSPSVDNLVTIPVEATPPIVEQLLKTDPTATGKPPFQHRIWNKIFLHLDIINSSTSIFSNAIGNKTYDTKYGYVTKGMDTAYDVVQKAASKFGPVGQMFGIAMGANKLLNNVATRYLGAGTDGMTKLDAIFGSAFLGPLGWINGWGGKRAKQYYRNTELDSQTNGGYQGFLTTQDITQIGAGKKYGLLSTKLRRALNRLTDFTENLKHSISGVVDSNSINLLASQGSTPFTVLLLSIDLNGGIQQMRAARKGMKVEKYKNPANPFLSNKNPFKQPAYKTPKGMKNLTPKRWGPEGMMLLYDKNGNPTRGLTRALELGYEPVVKYNGKAGFIGYDSNPALPYMLSAIGNYKNGALFCRRIVSKYSIGSKLRRSVQTIDVATGKYVDLPTDLTKELVNGQMPIKLSNGTVVFMLKNGTVTSDRWETVGEREHLTPKGLKGLKATRNTEFEERFKSEYPIFKDYNFIIVSDPNFTEENTGMGSIEYFHPYTKLIPYTDTFVYENPNEGGSAIVYNPENNDYNDVKLDLLFHGLRDVDPSYLAIVNQIRDLALEHKKDKSKERLWPIVEEADSKYDETPENRRDPYERYIENAIDGKLRNYFYFLFADPVKIEHKRYLGDKEQVKAEAKEWLPYIKLIGLYLGFDVDDLPEYDTIKFQKGGQMNVIPEGALHARLNHMKDVDEDLAKLITHKGIPVITVEKDGEVVQHAEIEHSEIIYNLEVTNKIEDLRKKYKETKDDKYAIEAGKILCYETLHNIDDRMNLIPNVV